VSVPRRHRFSQKRTRSPRLSPWIHKPLSGCLQTLALHAVWFFARMLALAASEQAAGFARRLWTSAGGRGRAERIGERDGRPRSPVGRLGRGGTRGCRWAVRPLPLALCSARPALRARRGLRDGHGRSGSVSGEHGVEARLGSGRCGLTTLPERSDEGPAAAEMAGRRRRRLSTT